MSRPIVQFLLFVSIVGFFVSLALGATLLINAIYRLVHQQLNGPQVGVFSFEFNQLFIGAALGLIPIAPFAMLYLYCGQLLKRDRESSAQ